MASEEIFHITKDAERAKHLFEIAKDRFGLMHIYPKEKIYKIIEEYYETIKELLTIFMYVDGYKTLSHKKLIDYFSENYNNLNESQLKLIDILRRFRNGIVYYGEKVNKDFLVNNEDEMKNIVKILIKLAEGKLK